MFMLLDLGSNSEPKPFRFKLFWLNDNTLIEKMESWWKEESVVGKPGYVLAKKIKALKLKLREWVKETYGRPEDWIQKWENILNGIEIKEETTLLTEDEKKNKHEARLKLEEAMADEEQFWAQKSKRLWKKFWW